MTPFPTNVKCLLKKLYGYGIRGKVLRWIESFLEGRTQSVRIGSEISTSASVLSGIPQGSVLGPILFLIFINDLPEVVQSTVKIFADDTKIYSAIETSTDCDKIQSDLDNLANWSEEWLLKFNVNKCKSMHIGRHNSKHEYHMKVKDSFVPLVQTNEEKDIGVTFDECMKFDVHVSNIVNRANQRVGLIRRSFEYLDKDMFLLLYKSLIRPILEYAAVIWSPWMKKDIVAIEQVQRRATRLVKEIQKLSYENRLKELGLPTLIYRRERADMIQIFKILNSYDEVQMKSLNYSQNVKTRGHSKKLAKRHYNLKSTQNSFSARCVNNWNNLPQNCIDSSSVNAFKDKLNDAWRHKPSKFYYRL